MSGEYSSLTIKSPVVSRLTRFAIGYVLAPRVQRVDLRLQANSYVSRHIVPRRQPFLRTHIPPSYARPAMGPATCESDRGMRAAYQGEFD